MLTDLSFLERGKPFPPDCTKHRLARYKDNRDLFEDKHERVYKEQFKRIDRVIGNFSEVVSYAVIANFQKLLSTKTADLVFGDAPKISAADDNIQDVLNKIIIDTQLWDKLYMSAIDVSRYGDTIIMQTADNVDVVAPALWYPVVDQFNLRQFKYHVFGYTYLIDTKSKQYGLKVQIHDPLNPGKCQEQLFELEGNETSDFKIGKPLQKPKDILVDTQLNTCPVYRVSNMLTSDRIFGIDDYRSVDSIISELMVRVSQVSKVLDKFASPSMTGPASALEYSELTQQYRVKVGNYFPRNNESDPKPEYLIWDASMDANFKQIEQLTNLLYTISEMGSAIFGDLSNKTGDVPSGSALRRLMMSPLAKARRIANRYDHVVKKLLSSLAQQRGTEITPQDITITWCDGLPADPAEDANIANVRTGGKPTLSQWTAIKRLDDMSDTDADAELEMIRGDDVESTAGTFPPMEDDTMVVDDGNE